MKKNKLVTCCVLVVFIAGLPAVCGAQSARVIPKGTLSVVENGKTVGEFQSEVPLPQGSSLVCHGGCLVQGDRFQLFAHDKTEFSLAKSDKEWVLTVKSGTVEFSMGKEAKLAFVTPKGKYQVTKKTPANGLIIGRVDVTAAGTEFATSAGVLYLASADGVQVIKPVADADVPAAGGGGISPWWIAGGAAVIGGAAAGAYLATKGTSTPTASSQ